MRYRYNKIIIIFSSLFIIISFVQCRKIFDDGQCISTGDDLATPTYSIPLWYVDGQRLCFNWLPLINISTVQTLDCGTAYNYIYNEDSSGFYIINRDGSNLRRLTNFQLDAPAWSPDGKWIAFCNSGTIYKMAFDGNNFDTTNIIAVTPSDSASHFFPTWNANGDTIFYDSDKGALPGTDFFHIWKISANGNGATLITPNLSDGDVREPFYTTDNKILHTRYVKEFNQVFSMDANGNSVTQITQDTSGIGSADKQNPRYFNNKFFYESHGIWSTNMDGSGLLQLTVKSFEGFSIARDGTIAFVYFDMSTLDKTYGTIWLMNYDGTAKRQLTHNNY